MQGLGQSKVKEVRLLAQPVREIGGGTCVCLGQVSKCAACLGPSPALGCVLPVHCCEYDKCHETNKVHQWVGVYGHGVECVLLQLSGRSSQAPSLWHLLPHNNAWAFPVIDGMGT